MVRISMMLCLHKLTLECPILRLNLVNILLVNVTEKSKIVTNNIYHNIKFARIISFITWSVSDEDYDDHTYYIMD